MAASSRPLSFLKAGSWRVLKSDQPLVDLGGDHLRTLELLADHVAALKRLQTIATIPVTLSGVRWRMPGDQFRVRAAACRGRAAVTHSPFLREQLLKLADEYELDAELVSESADAMVESRMVLRVADEVLGHR